MKTDVIVLMMMLLSIGPVSAQTACPQGVGGGSAQCGPSSLVHPEYGSRSNGPVLPAEKWSDSWGAMANDQNGMVTVVTDFPSKRKAKKGAVADCKKQGGEKCKAWYTFKNQCAALTGGETRAAAAQARTMRESIEIAKEFCRKDGGTDCPVLWSGCSHPWRIW